MRNTGDKITDILRADQRGHGSAIGFAGTARGENLMFSASQLRAKDGLPDLTAAPNRGIGQSGIGKIGSIQNGREGFLTLHGRSNFHSWKTGTHSHDETTEGNYLQGLKCEIYMEVGNWAAPDGGEFPGLKGETWATRPY